MVLAQGVGQRLFGVDAVGQADACAADPGVIGPVDVAAGGEDLPRKDGGMGGIVGSLVVGGVEHLDPIQQVPAQRGPGRLPAVGMGLDHQYVMTVGPVREGFQRHGGDLRRRQQQLRRDAVAQVFRALAGVLDAEDHIEVQPFGGFLRFQKGFLILPHLRLPRQGGIDGGVSEDEVVRQYQSGIPGTVVGVDQLRRGAVGATTATAGVAMGLI